MSDIYLTAPLPDYDGQHQPGITDPVWPPAPPEGVPDSEAYLARYAGQLERQRHLHLVTADVACTTREELRTLLRSLWDFADHQMRKSPPTRDARPFDPPVQSQRVTVTIGFGATLFTTLQGDDRFDLAARRPLSLRIIPQIDGDQAFKPSEYATDLVILIASDDYYVNEYIFGRLYYGAVEQLQVRRVERGYARPDSREPSGFEDGLTNPKHGEPHSEMHRLVYVTEADEEPAWCAGGTYLAYRKIRRGMAGFFKLTPERQREVFGVHKDSGERIEKPPANAHSQKMNPKRTDADGRELTDLFGMRDLERRFLRRPYFFDDGLDDAGEEVRGLHHLSFVRDLGAQYEWPVLMWQTNPDFPVKGAGRDALYEAGGASNIGGGYYFLPAAREDALLD